MIAKEEILKFIEDRNNICTKISDIIGYRSNMSDVPFLDYTKFEWSTQEESLFIKEEDEIYSYMISSYSSKDEKFYKGESDGYMYVMAYDDNDEWNDTHIFILDMTLYKENLE